MKDKIHAIICHRHTHTNLVERLDALFMEELKPYIETINEMIDGRAELNNQQCYGLQQYFKLMQEVIAAKEKNEKLERLMEKQFRHYAGWIQDHHVDAAWKTFKEKNNIN